MDISEGHMAEYLQYTDEQTDKPENHVHQCLADPASQQVFEPLYHLADIDELADVMDHPDRPHSPALNEDERHHGDGKRDVDVRIR